MSQATFSFFSLTTGAFSTRTYSGPLQDLAANTPDGHQAVLGVYSGDTAAYDLQRARVVTFDAAPPSFVELQGRAARAVLQEICSREALQARPLRELQLALALGQPVPPEALSKLAGLDQQLADLRRALSTINTATSEAGLPEVT